MTRLLPFLLLALVGFSSASCGGDKDSPEQHAQQTVAVMRSLVEVMAQIQDTASAEAARPQLDEIAGQIRALRERAEQLRATVDPTVLKEVGREAGMPEVVGLVMQQQQRLASNPELMAYVQPIMAEMME